MDMYPVYDIVIGQANYDPLRSLISSEALTPLIIVVVLPLYIYLLRPCLYNYIPGALKQIGLGMVFIFLSESALCTLLVDTAGRIQTEHRNTTLPVTTCFLNTDYYYQYDLYPRLHISSYVLIIQSVLNAIGYMLLYISMFEFICAHSPQSVKGVLICSFFAIKGVFRLLGNMVLFVPFTRWNLSYTFPSCGFVYVLSHQLLASACWNSGICHSSKEVSMPESARLQQTLSIMLHEVSILQYRS